MLFKETNNLKPAHQNQQYVQMALKLQKDQ